MAENVSDHGCAPVPHPSEMGEGDHAQRGGGGGLKRGVRHPPPPPPSAVPLPREAGEEPADVARARVVATARSWIGTPYRHQASLKGVGCDCLGLLVGVWRELQPSRYALRPDEELAIPPYTPDWAEALGRETFAEGLRARLAEIDVAEAREGDLVHFRWRAHLPAKHAGILVARDRMVHAQEGAKVAEVALSGWWRRRIAYAFSLAGAATLKTYYAPI